MSTVNELILALLADSDSRSKIMDMVEDTNDDLIVDACKNGNYRLAIELAREYEILPSALIESLKHVHGPEYFELLALFYRQVGDDPSKDLFDTLVMKVKDEMEGIEDSLKELDPESVSDDESPVPDYTDLSMIE